MSGTPPTHTRDYLIAAVLQSPFWKTQWEKEAVKSALTSALSLCQKSGWPGWEG